MDGVEKPIRTKKHSTHLHNTTSIKPTQENQSTTHESGEKKGVRESGKKVYRTLGEWE